MAPYATFIADVIFKGALLNCVFLFIITFFPLGVRFRNLDQQRKVMQDKLVHELLLITIGVTLVLVACFNPGWTRVWAVGLYLSFTFIWSSLRRKGFLWRDAQFQDGHKEKRWGVLGGGISDLMIVGQSTASVLLVIELLFQATSGINQTQSIVWEYIAGQRGSANTDPIASVFQRAMIAAANDILYAHLLCSLLFNAGRYAYEEVKENGGKWSVGVGGWIVTRGLAVTFLLISFMGNWFFYALGTAATILPYFLFTMSLPRDKKDWFEFTDMLAESHYVLALLVVIAGLGSGALTPETYGQHATAVWQTIVSGQFLAATNGQ